MACWLGRLKSVVVCLGALAFAGCTGISANPFRLGNLPAGDIVRTHAKPAGPGYYNDFDPAAATLTVNDVGGASVNQVRTQHVLVATVCDKDGNGRRNRRVEWHVSGVGHIVEVDESGLFNGRGYMVDDKYAVSYTNYKPHTLTRGNDNPADDVDLKPGQTFLVITSDQEGETHVTVHAPGIHNWDKHKVFHIKHWIDADAVLPPDATNLVGTPHEFVTQVVRHTDKTAAANYRVRYEILDGPPAVLDAPGVLQPGPVVEMPVALDGRAVVRLRQLQPMVGMNRIKVDVIRPPSCGSDRVLPIASRIVTKHWVAPNLTLEKLGPDVVAVGDRMEYTLRVANTGSVPTGNITLRDTLPPELELIGTNPIVALEGRNLRWALPGLPPMGVHQVQIAVRPLRRGVVHNVSEVVADNLPPKTASKPTRVVQGALMIEKIVNKERAVVGEPVAFTVRLKNVGDGPAVNISVRDDYDPALQRADGRPLALPAVPRLEPGEKVELGPFEFIPRAPGRLCNSVFARAENLTDTASAQACVEVSQPTLSVTKEILQPLSRRLFVGGEVQFRIVVANNGPIDAPNVLLRDPLPPELRYLGSDNAKFDPGTNLVLWDLGTLPAGKAREVRLRTSAVAPSIDQDRGTCNQATVVSNTVMVQSNLACVTIQGIPAYNIEVLPNRNPVIKGDSPTYVIKVINNGTVPLNITRLETDLPRQLRYEASIDPNGVKGDTTPDGGTVGFRQQFVIPPQRSVFYEVRVRAVAAGKVNITVRLFTTEFSTRDRPFLRQDQSTTIYDPNDAGSLDQSSFNRPRNGNILEMPVQAVSERRPSIQSEAKKPQLLPEPSAPSLLGPVEISPPKTQPARPAGGVQLDAPIVIGGR